MFIEREIRTLENAGWILFKKEQQQQKSLKSDVSLLK